MPMKVMKEQFVLDGDKLTHTPTGATFWLGGKHVVAREQGRLKPGYRRRLRCRRIKGRSLAHHGSRAQGSQQHPGLPRLIISVTNSRTDIGKEIRQ